MNTITFNDDNLTINDIEDRIIKTRAIMINDNREMLLSNYAGIYLLPGGKVEDDEDIVMGLIREVKEETGIDLDLIDQEPFLLIQQYIKNYPRRNTENNLSNRLNETYYFIVHTNELVNTDKMSLMENEIKADFRTASVKIDEVIPILEENVNNNPRNKYFKKELIAVMQELFKHIKQVTYHIK